MRRQKPFTNQQLFEFIDKAGKATWAGGGKEVSTPERPGFKELVYEKGNFAYRDSYTGHYRSWGMEVVRFKGEPVWISAYGGGMIEGYEELAEKTFEFLGSALGKDGGDFQSFRGPHKLHLGDWAYTYSQQGDVNEFWGYEEICYRGKLVFFHKIMGGRVIHKN